MPIIVSQLSIFPGKLYQTRSPRASEDYHLRHLAHKFPIGRILPPPQCVVECIEKAPPLSPFQQVYLNYFYNLLVFGRTRSMPVWPSDTFFAKNKPTHERAHAPPKQESEDLPLTAQRKPTLWPASDGTNDLPAPLTFLGDFEILGTLRLHSPAFYAIKTPGVFGKWAIDLEVDHLYQTQLRYMAIGGDYDGDRITPYSKPTMLDLNTPKSWISLNAKKPQR